MASDQRIRDPIHNLIKFSAGSEDDQVLWELVQSRPIQRLRRIKQLGFSDFVYPGASHSRFSHSLGALEMARRMLSVLTKNKEIGVEDGEDFKLWHRATLCAALLHDVGHGPFSHIFENISKEMGVEVRHEDFTLKIIKESEVAEILSRKDDKLLERTLSFFEEEPGHNIYSSIVSSELDADRLDFLCRDRYFTGIRFGEIDLEWLFDSLTIRQVHPETGTDVLEYNFVLSSKGRGVVEEYLMAYAHLYSSVYFHKTTRGIEVLIRAILSDTLSNPDYRSQLGKNNQLISYFEEGKEPKLDTYLALDDHTILTLIKEIASGDFGEVTPLAKRFLSRELLKCFEPPKHSQDAPPIQKIAAFEKLLNGKEIKYFRDVAPSKGYKQFQVGDHYLENILVASPHEDEPRPVGELSPWVQQLVEKYKVRLYFLNDDDRSSARDLWKSL